MNKIPIDSTNVRKSFREGKSQANFRWSFKPLLFCMNCALGLDLNVAKRKSKLVRFSVFALPFIIIVGHVVANGPCGFYSSVSNQRREEKYYSDSHSFGKIVPFAFLNVAKDLCGGIMLLATPIVHLVFVVKVLATDKWRKIWRSLESIQQSMALNQIFYRTCRKQILLTLALLILDFALFVRKYGFKDYGLNTPFSYYKANKAWDPATTIGIGSSSFICTKDWERPTLAVSFGMFHHFAIQYDIPVLAALLSRLAESGVKITFVAMLTTACIILDTLDEDIKDFKEEFPLNSGMCSHQRLSLEKLNEWKYHYNLACELIENINSCFGFTLLVAVIIESLDSIIEFQAIFIRGGVFPRYYFFFLHIIFRYFLLVNASHRVEQKSMGIIGSFGCIRSSDNYFEFQFQLHSVYVCIIEILFPKVNALNVVFFSRPRLLSSGAHAKNHHSYYKRLQDPPGSVSILVIIESINIPGMFIDNALQWGAVLYFAIIAGHEQMNYLRSPHEYGFFECHEYWSSKDFYCPCRISSSLDNDIACFRVPMIIVNEVFKKRSTDLHRNVLENFYMEIPLTEQFIPADLLANYSTKIISIECEDEVIQKLSIHPKAFRSSITYTSDFAINTCDLSRLNFTFLEGFQNLKSIRFGLVNNIHLADWASLPPLTQLDSINIFSSSDLNEWTNFPALYRGLTNVHLYNCFLRDESIDRILQWVIDSPSASSLQLLYLARNSLTRIPRQIRALSSLARFVATDNQITTIERESFFRNSSSICEIFLDLNEINRIESDAFQGNFGNVILILFGNNIERFESGAFYTVLQQMVSIRDDSFASFGQILLEKNPIDCRKDHCHLSWIIRDNRQFLTRLPGAACSNRTLLTDLNLEDFKDCPK